MSAIAQLSHPRPTLFTLALPRQTTKEHRMALIERAKNMIVTPKTEWDVVAAEPTAPGAIITGYVLPLAAVYAIATFIGTAMVIGFFGGFAGVGFALVAAIYHLV